MGILRRVELDEHQLRAGSLDEVQRDILRQEGVFRNRRRDIALRRITTLEVERSFYFVCVLLRPVIYVETQALALSIQLRGIQRNYIPGVTAT